MESNKIYNKTQEPIFYPRAGKILLSSNVISTIHNLCNVQLQNLNNNKGKEWQQVYSH